MYTASAQLIQRCRDLPNGSSESIHSSDDQVVALTEPADAFGPTWSVTPGPSGSRVSEYPIGYDASGGDHILLLIDRLLRG